MSIEATREQTTVRFEPPRWMMPAGIAVIVLGIIATILGFAIVNIVDTWLWLVVWFLVFGGLAQGMICWAAVFRTSQTRWTAAVNRLGHAAIAYLPVSFLAMIVLLIGVRGWVPWTHNPVPDKAAWLNIPFMVIRDIIMVAGLGVLDFFMVRWSLIADSKMLAGEELSDREHWRLTAIATGVVFGYVFTFTIISYDFIMSLAPEWYSTMFAPYYWVTNVYAAMAMVTIAAAIFRKPLGIVRFLQPSQFNDMGNLMLGFSLFSMGLFFAQYLTIWYGNLPEETFFLINRYYKGPWPYTAWAGFFLGYAIPFILLQSRKLKHNPFWLSVVAMILIIGVIIERYVLVVPSVVGIHRVGLSVIPAFSILFFLGTFVLSYVFFLKSYPPYSTADAVLDERQKVEVLT